MKIVWQILFYFVTPSKVQYSTIKSEKLPETELRIKFSLLMMCIIFVTEKRFVVDP